MCDVSSGHAAVGLDNGTVQQVDESHVIDPAESCDPTPAEESPTIGIVINNVVCSFSTRCHLNLRKIAMEGMNVEFKKENGMVTMKLRKPHSTASIWSSGKITCTGATSEEDAKVAARRFSRCLQNMGFRIRLTNFRVVNVLGTCTMPFGIRIAHFSQAHRKNASYEPELHPGVTYRIAEPKATLKVFSTGSITITAPCVQNIQLAVEHIFPLVYPFKMADEEYRKIRQNSASMRAMNKKRPTSMFSPITKQARHEESSDDEFGSLSEESDNYDTDQSFD